MEFKVFKTQLNPFDRGLEFLSSTVLVVLISLPLFYYHKLPENIPLHFNSSGQADRYGGSEAIWVLPIIGMVVYLVLNALKKNPHIFKKSHNLTKVGIGKVYVWDVRLINFLKFVITLALAFSTYSIAQFALGN